MMFFFFFSSRRRHTRCSRDWSSDVCSSDLPASDGRPVGRSGGGGVETPPVFASPDPPTPQTFHRGQDLDVDRKSTRLNSSHGYISYAVFCLKKKITITAAPTGETLYGKTAD